MKTQNKQVITVFLLMLVAGISIWYLGSLPIEENRFAFDWRMFWQATHSFRIDYTGVLVFNPPWTLALLWVFTIFPLSASWAFFSFFYSFLSGFVYPTTKGCLEVVWDLLFIIRFLSGLT